MDLYEVAYCVILGAVVAGLDAWNERSKKGEPPDRVQGEAEQEKEEDTFFDAEEPVEEVAEEGLDVVAILLAELDAMRKERDELRSKLAATLGEEPLESPKLGAKRSHEDPPADVEPDPTCEDNKEDNSKDSTAPELEARIKRRRTGGEEVLSADPVQPKVEVDQPSKSPATGAFFSADPVQPKVEFGGKEANDAESPTARPPFVFQSMESTMPTTEELENPFLMKEETAEVPKFEGSQTPAAAWWEDKEPTVEEEAPPEKPNHTSFGADRHAEDLSMALVGVDENQAPPPPAFDEDYTETEEEEEEEEEQEQEQGEQNFLDSYSIREKDPRSFFEKFRERELERVAAGYYKRPIRRAVRRNGGGCCSHWEQ